MPKFFKTPFAISGDKSAIPEALQPSGEVSYEEGFGFDYERDQTSDPLAKDVPRDQSNQLYFDVTENIGLWQRHGYPDFITTAANGGTPFDYDIHSYVRWDDGAGADVYESLVDANTSLPSDETKWRRVRPVSGIPTGSGMDYHLLNIPDGGWIWADGKTIGSPSSGATNRANLDVYNLFVSLWSSQSNAVLPIQSSTGAASVRGISAAADWAANKRLPVPDKRGRGSVGKDDIGGTAANRLTADTPQGINGSVLGASGGEQSHANIDAENGTHTHGPGTLAILPAGNHSHGYVNENGGGNVSGGINAPTAQVGLIVQTQTAGEHVHDFTGTVGNSGSGTPHNNVQPSLVCNYIIKL